jgi:hypothetical protein
MFTPSEFMLQGIATSDLDQATAADRDSAGLTNCALGSLGSREAYGAQKSEPSETGQCPDTKTRALRHKPECGMFRLAPAR